MKKTFLIFAVIGFVITTIVSCRDNELKDVRVQVESLDVKGDTLKSMKATLDGDTLLFSLEDVKLNNGLMIHGDSVIVNYIQGRKGVLRALVVTVLPKAPHIIDLNEAKTDTLITAPGKSEEDVAKQ